MATIPDQYQDLLQKKAFAHLGTLMKDGSPQVTPIWFGYDGAHILINSAKGRLKDKNMRKRPQVALSILDPDNPYRYMQIRGKVVEVTENGADAHIDALAKKYLDQDKYPFRQPGEVRVIYKMEVQRVQVMG
jgi:PPOX class probable F420-dependent enzyme